MTVEAGVLVCMYLLIKSGTGNFEYYIYINYVTNKLHYVNEFNYLHVGSP